MISGRLPGLLKLVHEEAGYRATVWSRVLGRAPPPPFAMTAAQEGEGVLLVTLTLALCAGADSAEGRGYPVVSVHPSAAINVGEQQQLRAVHGWAATGGAGAAVPHLIAQNGAEKVLQAAKEAHGFAWLDGGVCVGTLREEQRGDERCATLHVIGLPDRLRIAIDGVVLLE